MNAKTKRFIKILTPILLALAIIVGAVVFFANYEPYNLASIKKNPEDQLIKSFRKTAAVLEEGMAFRIPDAVPNSIKTGSLGISMTSQDDTQVNGKLFLRDDRFAVLATAGAKDQDPVAYELWADKDQLALNIPTQDGNQILGIAFDTLKADLKDSGILKALEMDYDQVVEILDTITQMLPNEEEEKSGKDWKTLLEMKRRLETLLNSCAVNVKEGELNLDLGPTKVYRVSYAMTPAQMCEAMDIVVSWLITTDAYAKATEGMENATSQFQNGLKELKDQIVDSNATAILNFYLHHKTQIINQMELRVDWFVDKEPATFLAVARIGQDPVQALRYTADISVSIPEEDKQSLNITYERSQAHNLPGRKLVIKADGEEYVLMDMQVNSVTKAFNLSLFDDSIELSGVCSSDDDHVYLTLDTEQLKDLTITFTGTEEMPTMPQYTNICSLSELEALRLLIDYLPSRNADLSFVDTEEEEFRYEYVYDHRYCTLGDLLVGEGLAALDHQGHLLTITNYEGPAMTESYAWEIYLNGELVEGNLYEIILRKEAEVEIRDVTDYPEQEEAA